MKRNLSNKLLVPVKRKENPFIFLTLRFLCNNVLRHFERKFINMQLLGKFIVSFFFFLFLHFPTTFINLYEFDLSVCMSMHALNIFQMS